MAKTKVFINQPKAVAIKGRQKQLSHKQWAGTPPPTPHITDYSKLSPYSIGEPGPFLPNTLPIFIGKPQKRRF